MGRRKKIPTVSNPRIKSVQTDEIRKQAESLRQYHERILAAVDDADRLGIREVAIDGQGIMERGIAHLARYWPKLIASIETAKFPSNGNGG